MAPPISAFGLTDPAGSLTHLIGAVVFLILGIRLVRSSLWSRPRWISLAVFASSAVLLLLASGLFHAMPSDTPIRALFQRIDHSAIFILIAGTFTPIHVILFKGVLRWGVLVPVWIGACVGILLKVMYFESTPEWLGVTIYLVMGWAGVIAMYKAWRMFNLRFVSPLILGGLAYTVGALCELTGEPTLIEGVIRSHEVFHLAVLVGLGSMWGFITRLSRLPVGLTCGSTIEAKPVGGAPKVESKESAGPGNSHDPKEVA